MTTALLADPFSPRLWFSIRCLPARLRVLRIFFAGGAAPPCGWASTDAFACP